MRVKLNDIFLDEDIYPRQNISNRTVESYVEALKGGAVFPAIEVQKVVSEEGGREEEKLICLDGWHRILAYKEYNKQVKNGKISEIEASFWRSGVLNKKEFLEELRLESARRNLTHGDRISSIDLEFQLLRIVKERPIDKLNGIVSELAKKLNYDPSYISRLIGEEVRKRKVSRDAKIYRVSLLGWTNKEIGSIFGLTEGAIREIRKNFTSQISTIQEQFYKQHKSVEELANFFYPQPLLIGPCPYALFFYHLNFIHNFLDL